jgi:hypothetical protein
MRRAFDLAVLKANSRQSRHSALAVDAVYYDDETPSKPITVRWHNKLARAGALEGGFGAEVIEGINRLVFNESELTSAGITLRHEGRVTIPQYNLTFSLDSQEPPDGPVNVYWTVAQVIPVQDDADN